MEEQFPLDDFSSNELLDIIEEEIHFFGLHMEYHQRRATFLADMIADTFQVISEVSNTYYKLDEDERAKISHVAFELEEASLVMRKVVEIGSNSDSFTCLFMLFCVKSNLSYMLLDIVAGFQVERQGFRAKLNHLYSKKSEEKENGTDTTEKGS